MPKRFQFRLEPVLRVRGAQEDEARRAFAAAQRAAQEQARKLADIATQERRARAEMADTRRGPVNLVRVRLEEGYLVGVGRRIDREKQTLAKKLEEQFVKRTAFVEARKKVRVLERLKERRQTEYRREVEREEQKTLDEVGGVYHRRGVVP